MSMIDKSAIKTLLQEKLNRYLHEWPNTINPPRHLEVKLSVSVAYIERALQKLDQGTYGVCDACEENIPQERLEIVPGAIRCMACEDAFAQQRKAR
jgi:formylmethanofuran dehydrogenase subunit E